MAAPPTPEQFFISGGTVPLLAGSYVERGADRALLAALVAGRYCYVLNSRQMGKSSICVRTMAKLSEQGYRTAFIDLTRIGGRNVTAEQWYAGLIGEVGRGLELRTEMLAYWKEHTELSAMQRFFGALRDVALESSAATTVLFIDEIDSTRSLPFSTDEFFAGVRECYNRRVLEPAYQRLVFCLLGVAIPSDLISDPTTTPFNVGERILLRDFTLEEAAVLADGLGANGKDVLERIYHWTGGHPFLTQSLCASAVDRKADGTADVDRMVEDLLFQTKARETNINLADVGNRVLNGWKDRDELEAYRSDILSLYAKVLRGQKVSDDESNRLIAILKLAGLLVVDGGSLKVRNRIYERTFDKEWIRENMPGAELRRQRTAYLLGVFRTAVLAAVVLATIGFLAWNNARLAALARAQRDKALYDSYVSDLNYMPELWAQGNLRILHRLLDETSNNPARGWEWEYWNRVAHSQIAESGPVGSALTLYKTPDEKSLVYRDRSKIVWVDPASGKVVRTLPAMDNQIGYAMVTPDGDRLIEAGANGGISVRELPSGKPLFRVPNNYVLPPNDPQLAAMGAPEFFAEDISGYNVAINLETGAVRELPGGKAAFSNGNPSYAPDGMSFATPERSAARNEVGANLVIRDSKSFKAIKRLATPFDCYELCFSGDGRRLFSGSEDGWVQCWDVQRGEELWRSKIADSLTWEISSTEDGNRLLVISGSRSSVLLEGRAGKVLARYGESATGELLKHPFRLAVLGSKVRIYNPKIPNERRVLESRQRAGGSVNSADDPSKVWLISGSHLQFIDTEVPRVERDLNFEDPIYTIDQEGRNAVVAKETSWDFFDSRTGKPLMSVPKRGLALLSETTGSNPDEAYLLLVSKKMELWSLSKGQLLKSFSLAEIPTIARVTGGVAVVGDSQGGLTFIDVASGSQTYRPRVHQQAINFVTFSKQGTHIAVGSNNGDIRIWDVATAEPIVDLRGHTSTATYADFSPDGRRVASVGSDGTCRVWDAATGQQLTMVNEHRGILLRCGFTSDGKSIYCVCIDGTVFTYPTTAAVR